MLSPSAVRSSGPTCQSIHTAGVVPTADVYLHHCMSVHSGLLLPIIICSITKAQHTLYSRQCQPLYLQVHAHNILSDWENVKVKLWKSSNLQTLWLYINFYSTSWDVCTIRLVGSAHHLLYFHFPSLLNLELKCVQWFYHKGYVLANQGTEGVAENNDVETVR